MHATLLMAISLDTLSIKNLVGGSNLLFGHTRQMSQDVQLTLGQSASILEGNLTHCKGKTLCSAKKTLYVSGQPSDEYWVI